MGRRQHRNRQNDLSNTSPQNSEEDKDEESSLVGIIKKWTVYIGFLILVATGGYNAGVYKSDIEHGIKIQQINREHDEKTEELSKKLREHEMLNTNYVTKEELEEVKKNMEKFYNHEQNRE